MTNPLPPTPASPNRYNLLAVLGVFVLAVIGVGFLVLAVVLLLMWLVPFYYVSTIGKTFLNMMI